MIGILYYLSSTVCSLNNIKYDWSNTSTLLYHLPKIGRYVLLRLRCSIYLIIYMSLTSPLIPTAKSSVQDLEIMLFKIEKIYTLGKIRYIDAPISLCLIQFGNIVSYF